MCIGNRNQNWPANRDDAFLLLRVVCFVYNRSLLDIFSYHSEVGKLFRQTCAILLWQ
jgi:hypothetical protein